MASGTAPESDSSSRDLHVDVLHRTEAGEVETDFFADFVRQVAVACGFEHGSVVVVLAGDDEVKDLNRRFRSQDRVTDILSFPEDAAADGVSLHGEMIIAAGKAQRQAAQRHHSLSTEFRYLLIHGALHLMGLDHELDDGQMDAEERRVRGLLLSPVGRGGAQVKRDES